MKLVFLISMFFVSSGVSAHTVLGLDPCKLVCVQKGKDIPGSSQCIYDMTKKECKEIEKEDPTPYCGDGDVTVKTYFGANDCPDHRAGPARHKNKHKHKHVGKAKK